MKLITIECEHGIVDWVDGKLPRARREWTVTGKFEFYLKGQFTPVQYDQACTIALHVVMDNGIKADELKRVDLGQTSQGRKIDPSQKSLF